LLEAVQADPQNSVALELLATDLGPTEVVELPHGDVVGAKELLRRAILAAPTRSATPYVRLASLLSDDEETVTLQRRRQYNRRRLYLRALKVDLQCSEAYCNLATTMGPGERVNLPSRRRPMDRRALYVEAARCDAHSSAAYFNLALTLADGETVSLANGTAVDNAALYALSIHVDPLYKAAYFNLAACLHDGEQAVLVDGSLVDRPELYRRARELDTGAVASASLQALAGGKVPDADGYRRIRGRSLTTRQLMVKALQMDGSYRLAIEERQLFAEPVRHDAPMMAVLPSPSDGISDQSKKSVAASLSAAQRSLTEYAYHQITGSQLRVVLRGARLLRRRDGRLATERFVRLGILTKLAVRDCDGQSIYSVSTPAQTVRPDAGPAAVVDPMAVIVDALRPFADTVLKGAKLGALLTRAGVSSNVRRKAVTNDLLHRGILAATDGDDDATTSNPLQPSYLVILDDIT
jgi:hypothetical protein